MILRILAVLVALSFTQSAMAASCEGQIYDPDGKVSYTLDFVERNTSSGVKGFVAYAGDAKITALIKADEQIDIVTTRDDERNPKIWISAALGKGAFIAETYMDDGNKLSMMCFRD